MTLEGYKNEEVIELCGGSMKVKGGKVLSWERQTSGSKASKMGDQNGGVGGSAPSYSYLRGDDDPVNKLKFNESKSVLCNPVLKGCFASSLEFRKKAKP